MRAQAARSAGAGVTVTDLLVVALARALAEVPELNGVRRGDGSVERSQAVHLSIAVATPAGVVAPVLRDAGSLTLADVARERRASSRRPGTGTLDGRDLAGGTCTLSNLGAYPVDFFAPVVSGPQVAMVATGRVAEQARRRGRAGRRPADACGSTSPSTTAPPTARQAAASSPHSSASSHCSQEGPA